MKVGIHFHFIGANPPLKRQRVQEGPPLDPPCPYDGARLQLAQSEGFGHREELDINENQNCLGLNFAGSAPSAGFC
jgi:hypothetical protein